MSDQKMSMEDLQKHYARQALQNQGPFNLQHTIEDPSCLKYLKRFCKEADLSEEILLAFLDIQMFNQLPKGEQRTSMASRIVDDYFEDGAPMLVGLSEKHRRDVISKLTREGGPQDDGLQQVSELLRDTLFNDIFPRFVTSRYYNKMITQKCMEMLSIGVDDFELLHFLGAGGYGMVLLSKLKKTGQYFAFKVIDKHIAVQEDKVLNVFREKEVLALVDHPFIVSLHYAMQTDDYLCLVMDFVAGGNMYYEISVNGCYSLPKATFYAAQVVLALEYLHSLSIIYRDLKPDNILLTGRGYLKLADMGASRGTAADGMIEGGVSSTHHKTAADRHRRMTISGTHGYRAPEVYDRKYGQASDWWGLGLLIVEMLTGVNPLRGADKKASEQMSKSKYLRLPGDMDVDARALVTGLLEREVEMRLGSPRDKSDGSLETLSEAVAHIKDHPFFTSINWSQLFKCEMTPPFPVWNARVSELLEPGDVPRSIESFCDIVGYLREAKEERMMNSQNRLEGLKTFNKFDYVSPKVYWKFLRTMEVEASSRAGDQQ